MTDEFCNINNLRNLNIDLVLAEDHQDKFGNLDVLFNLNINAIVAEHCQRQVW